MRHAALLVIATGCGVPELAPTMRMTGEASGTDSEGRTGTCALDLVFEVEEETGKGTWTGTHGGEISRSVLEPDESGLAFFVDVFGEVEYETARPDVLEIRIPINETAEGRFYTELAAFSGTLDDDGVGHGDWTCAPLDIDQGGYLDTEVIVDGTWELAPAEG